MSRKTDVIIALDVDTRKDAWTAIQACEDCSWFKVGLQLFSRSGPAIPRYLLAKGKHVFLDLKLHDIPNTVAKAARAAADLGVDLITVHAAGGRRMVAAAREAVEGSETRVLSVTLLTSIDNTMLQDEIGLQESPEAVVARYARMAVAAGAHGVVASPREARMLRATLGDGPLIVSPGVRPKWAGKDDQARVETPAEAAAAGADFIVVGRPILHHANPGEALRLIQEELGR